MLAYATVIHSRIVPSRGEGTSGSLAVIDCIISSDSNMATTHDNTHHRSEQSFTQPHHCAASHTCARADGAKAATPPEGSLTLGWIRHDQSATQPGPRELPHVCNPPTRPPTHPLSPVRLQLNTSRLTTARITNDQH